MIVDHVMTSSRCEELGPDRKDTPDHSDDPGETSPPTDALLAARDCTDPEYARECSDDDRTDECAR